MLNVSKTIREKLLNDLDFRLNTAKALRVKERNIENLAKSNSENLTKYAAVIFYKSTGLTDEEIFETETAL